MAAAATAAAGLGGRAAGSAGPPLRRGRGRRRRREAGVTEEEAGASSAAARRSSQREGLDRPLCRGRPLPAWPAPAPAGEPGPPSPAAQAERDFVFRAPIMLSKHGEVPEEYKSHLRKTREEKWQEERPSEDLTHRVMVEDAEGGRRRSEEQRKEELLLAKTTQDHLPECLSDSENEEPFQGRSGYRSAFVSKGSANSVALSAGNFCSKIERSQSCNDTLRDRSKSRQRAAPVRTKANPLAGAAAPLAGVLSSTQNNRCLSAPDLAAEKQLSSHAAASFPLPHKPERSVSPESNDSISEELNHFKPIVCSPCTPPKRLPDGRVLNPLVIKSTPRNLTRSLQKPTTYEASPRMLKKWEQIFQERQIKRTLSKATLTSLAPESEDFLVPDMNLLVREPLAASKDPLPPDAVPSGLVAKLESSGPRRREAEADGTPRAPPEKPPSASFSEASEAKPHPHLAGSCLNVDAKRVPQEVVRIPSAFPENGTLGAGRKRLKHWDPLPNGFCLEKGRGEDPASLPRGQKRRCKTKHADRSAKRPRQAARKGSAVPRPLSRGGQRRRGSGTEPRRPQEAAGRQKLESESRTGEGQKGRADQYLLRSKSTTGAK